jgi:hypothetical protein
MDRLTEAAHRMVTEMKKNDWCTRDLGSGVLAFVNPRSVREQRFAPYDLATLQAARELGLIEPRTIKVLWVQSAQIEDFDLYSPK